MSSGFSRLRISPTVYCPLGLALSQFVFLKSFTPLIQQREREGPIVLK